MRADNDRVDLDNTSLAAFAIAVSLLIIWVDPTDGGTGPSAPTTNTIEATAYVFMEGEGESCADPGEGYGASTQVDVLQHDTSVGSVPLTEGEPVAMGCRYRIDYITRFGDDAPVFRVDDKTLVLGEWHNDGTPSVMPSRDFAPGTTTTMTD